MFVADSGRGLMRNLMHEEDYNTIQKIAMFVGVMEVNNYAKKPVCPIFTRNIPIPSSIVGCKLCFLDHLA